MWQKIEETIKHELSKEALTLPKRECLLPIEKESAKARKVGSHLSEIKTNGERGAKAMEIVAIDWLSIKRNFC